MPPKFRFKPKNVFLVVTEDWIEIVKSSFLLRVKFCMPSYGTPQLDMFEYIFLSPLYCSTQPNVNLVGTNFLNAIKKGLPTN